VETNTLNNISCGCTYVNVSKEMEGNEEGESWANHGYKGTYNMQYEAEDCTIHEDGILDHCLKE
jgi:hypothetical protein